ncbi:MAG: tetratricopeptide repeat protein [Bacteroidia bacterium]|nr:tetratricopeptide repeat protein [Bacteroidia bacterium]
MKTLTTALLLLLCLRLSAQTLPGRVTLQNSGRKPVPGATVKASLSNSTQTAADGSFSLSFAGKAPGYDVVLEIEKEGLEVVNKKDLFTTLKTDPSEALSLYMCPKGQWEQAAMAYYNINEQHILRRYREEVERVKQRYAQQEALMQDSLRILSELFTATNAQARELAETFAIANLDDATDLYVSAFNLFKQGDVQGALRKLDASALSADLSRIRREQAQGQQLIAIGQGRLVAAQEAIHQGIENYKLKARLCVIDYRFDEAERSFRKAVEADTMNFDNVFEFADFLRKQSRSKLATQQYERALQLATLPEQRAMAQNNLGTTLTDQNDYTRAITVYEEALKIYRKLAKAKPDTYVPEVALTLNNLGVALEAQNDYSRAIAAYEESLIIRRRLAEANPEIYLPGVAATLNNLGIAWAGQSEYGRAIPAYEESLKIRSKLAETNPELYNPDVAATLNNLSVAWKDQNDYLHAIPAYQEALQQYRKLAEINPEVYTRFVALVLNNLGNALAEQSDHDGAISVYQDVLQLYRKLAETNPEVYTPFVALTLNNQGIAWANQNDYARAASAYEDALNIRRKLAETNPNAFAPDLASTLNNLGVIWKDQNYYARAINALEEALKIRRSFAEVNPKVYLPDVVQTLNNLGMAWKDQKDYTHAISAYEEALQICRKLAKSSKSVYLPDLATTLHNIGIAWFPQNQPNTARLYLQEAVKIRQKLAIQQVEVFGTETAASLSVLGTIHHQLGQSAERDRYWEEARQWLNRSPETMRRAEIKGMLDQLKQITEQSTVQGGNPLAQMQMSIETAPTYTEKVQLQQKLIEYVKSNYGPNKKQVRNFLSQQYGNLSWYALFTQDYPLAETAAKRALELDPAQLYVHTNLGHSYLLRGRYQEAQEAYKPLLGKKDDSGKPYEQVILEDLAELEKEGITHPDVQKIRKWLMP